MGTLLDSKQIVDGLAGLAGWDRSGDDAITATYKASTFTAAVALVDAVAVAAERAGHHPDIDIRYDTVVFILSTHSDGGVTAKDMALAGEIAGAAAAAGAVPTG